MLQPDCVYNVLCVHRPRQERCKAGVFEELIRILFIVDEYFRVFIGIIDIILKRIAFILKQCRQR